ncbi:hypothetical protein [Fulvivirga sedimenti]|jgi:hypothetical protein|uniref:DUF4878 domain-containing protein n=1 Tax=Fulvivirga sedimenti TaxID=2879465 RepID=A0A9X1KYN5_9BACT|nr:hypothetical protein [Fulvivirga sedimenti]MCA6073801.1 hypothetical protein [Fulvivirga sedimenti]
MKKLVLSLLFLFPAVLFAQEEEVKATFDSFKAAMVEGNTDAVLALTSASSMEYYSNMLDMVLYADSAKVAALPLIQKIGVLGTRVRIPKEDLIGMDGESFFRYNIDNNKQNSQQIQMLGIGDVMSVDDNTAQGQVTANGQALPMSINFVQEGSDWKIDMSSLENMSEGQLNQIIQQSGMDFNQFLKMAMAQQGMEVDDSIWQPLAEK